jgi:hypothetical protein
MWLWFHPGWMVIVPLAMMLVCILMCIFVRWHVFGGSILCCGHRQSECDTESKKGP